MSEPPQCAKCGTVHQPNAKTYFSVAGNLYIGSDGGLIGNNFDEAGLLASSSVFCTRCLIENLLDAAIDAKLQDAEERGVWKRGGV